MKKTSGKGKSTIANNKNLPLPLEGSERTLYLMRAFWRPILSLVYVLIILFDFIFFPLGWSILQTYLVLKSNTTIEFIQWSPMTLNHAGLFHVVMGSFLGITSFTRSLEKRSGVVDDDIVPVLYDEETTEKTHTSYDTSENMNFNEGEEMSLKENK